jgi:hypothetical protein
VLEVLSPGVQHAEQSDIGTQVLRVASDFEQRGGTGTKEQIVEGGGYRGFLLFRTGGEPIYPSRGR